PFPDRPDYQPNRAPKRPNATVNKFCILRLTAVRKGDSHEWHSVKPNTLGLKVLRTKTPARRPMINNMISISLDGKPCVSEAYSILCIYNSITLILVRVERKSLIRKTLILIRVPFVTDTELATVDLHPHHFHGEWNYTIKHYN